MSEQTVEAEVVQDKSLLPQTTPKQEIVSPDAKEKKPMTAIQGKVDAVAHLTMSAYEKASTLDLTPEESAALQADFPDEAFKPGAAGKENLLYIEHAFLRDRLTQVFGMGKWTLVPRSRWDVPFKTDKGVEATTVYVEAMLVVRGCFVAEAIGDMVYYPKNQQTNYGDAVEGAESSALRRCCKKFGIGLQAWKKDWCEGWWQRNRSKGKTVAPTPRARPAPPAPPAKKEGPKEATEVTKKWFIERLAGDTDAAEEYMIALGWIMENETVNDVSLNWVPTSVPKFDQFITGMRKFFETGAAENPYLVAAKAAEKPIEVPRDPDAGDETPDWHDYPMPFGKDQGVAMGEVAKNTLWGWWNNFVVETEFKGRPVPPEKIAVAQEFRAMLDIAGEHYGFKRKD